MFVLSGPVDQQDLEIAALYRDAQLNFGQKNILGILATRNEHFDHSVYKRQAKYESTTEFPSTTPSGDEPVVDNIYADVKGWDDQKNYISLSFAASFEKFNHLNMWTNKCVFSRALLFTSEAPILTIRGNKTDDIIYSLEKHAIVTADERDTKFRLIIKFIVPEIGAVSLSNSCFLMNLSNDFLFSIDPNTLHLSNIVW